MTIGFDVRTLIGKPLFGANNPAGVPGYVSSILKELIQIDTKNRYILFSNAFKKPDESLFHKVKNYSNVDIVTSRIPNKIFDHSARVSGYPRIDKIIKEKTNTQIDVYITPHINIARLSPSVRRITIVHDLTFDYFPGFFPFRKRYWHTLQAVAQTLKQSSVICTVSRNTAHDIIQRYAIRPEKIVHISFGLDHMFEDNKEAEPTQVHVPKKPYILFLGTLEPRKNIESIIESFELLKDAHQGVHCIHQLQLIIAGGRGWLYSPIMKAVASSKWKRDIQVLGYVSSEKKNELLRHARCFVFPSYYEGIGLPPLEAMAYGVPVVTGNTSSLTEVTGRAAITIDQYNVQHLTHAIYAALTDGALRSTLIERGKKQVEGYSWTKTAHALRTAIQ